MIKHVMADGSRRDSIEGCIIPREISKTILLLARKEHQNGNRNTSGDSKK